MGWDWEWGAGPTAACWRGGLVRRGGMGHGCTGCRSWVVLGGALIDVVVVPSIAHLAVITAAATLSPIKLGNSILGQGLLYTSI